MGVRMCGSYHIVWWLSQFMVTIAVWCNCLMSLCDGTVWYHCFIPPYGVIMWGHSLTSQFDIVWLTSQFVIEWYHSVWCHCIVSLCGVILWYHWYYSVMSQCDVNMLCHCLMSLYNSTEWCYTVLCKGILLCDVMMWFY